MVEKRRWVDGAVDSVSANELAECELNPDFD